MHNLNISTALLENYYKNLSGITCKWIIVALMCCGRLFTYSVKYIYYM